MGAPSCSRARSRWASRSGLPGSLASRATPNSDNELRGRGWRREEAPPKLSPSSPTVVRMAWFKKERKPRTSERVKLEIPADAWENCDECGHIDIKDRFVRAL